MPQPFLLLIAANLTQDGFLGWKWSLWHVPAWLVVQRRKAAFFLTLYDSINDKPMDAVSEFRYLGRLLTATDDDWPAVAGNI